MGLVENQSLSTIDIDREFVDDVDHLSPINFVNYDRIGSIIVSNNITFNINEYNTDQIIDDQFDQWPTPRPYITLNGVDAYQYRLIDIRFYGGNNSSSLSIHSIDTIHYPLEVHLIHIRDDLNRVAIEYAIIVVFFDDRRVDGKLMHDFNDLINSIDNNDNDTNNSYYQSKWHRFSPFQILPTILNDFYRYNGSMMLINRNCQHAIWTVLSEPVYINNNQLSIFRKYAIDTTDSNLQLQLNKCRINDKKYLFLHRIDDDSIDSIDYPITID